MSKLSQKGVIHFLIPLILLIGIVAGVYLVQKTQIFKPKAYEITDNQDTSAQPAEMSKEDYENWVTQMHLFGIYPAKENGEVILYNRAQFVEKYCQPQGCILNPPTFGEIISATKADVGFIKDLGVKLKENDYAPLTVLKLYFPDIINLKVNTNLYLELDSLEPACEQDPPPLDCRGGDRYKKEISEQDLTKYITQVATERGLSEKDPLKRLINASDPIFGTKALITWATLPPNEVSDEERISALLSVVSLPYVTVGRTVALGGRASITLTKPLLKGVSEVRAQIFRGERTTLDYLSTVINRWVSAGMFGRKVILRSKSMFIEDEVFDGLKEVKDIVDNPDVIKQKLRSRGLPEEEIKFREKNIRLRISAFKGRFAGFDEFINKRGMHLEDLIVRGLARHLPAQEIRSVYDELAQKLISYKNGELANRIPVLHIGYQSQALAENNWVYVLKAEEYVKLYGNSAAIADGPFIVISEAYLLNQPGLLQHEFIHNISHNLALFFVDRVHFSYNQEQASKYGAVMSQIYELSTDLVVEELYGVDSVYRQKYPLLSKSIDGLMNRLIKEGKGTLSKVDFMEFALTGSDEGLRGKISKFLSPDEFISMIDREIDAARLTVMIEEARERMVERTRKVVIAASYTGSGTMLFSRFLTDGVSGQRIPQNITISQDVIEFNQDQDLTK